jgi:hypothetical protein
MIQATYMVHNFENTYLVIFARVSYYDFYKLRNLMILVLEQSRKCSLIAQVERVMHLIYLGQTLRA